MNRRASTALLALSLACAHGESFTSEPARADAPFTSSQPLRLTYNVGADEWPAWTANGKSILYSVQDSLRRNPTGLWSEPDQCIARMPASGGTAPRIACPAMPVPNDTTQIFDQPAAEGANLVYSSSELGVIEHAPFRHAIWLADTTPFSRPTRVLGFPYTAPSGKPHDAPIYLQWLRPGVLLYLGAENGCCRKDTLRFGEQIVLLDLSSGTPALSFIPGTTRASAVSRSLDGSTIYYTFYGDSVVWSRHLASGTVSVVHNFGSGHIVRDPAVAGGRMVAVVDGLPNYADVPAFGMVQIDYGGLLVVVDLATGAETWLPDHKLLYKRPAFAPDGASFAVEGFPYVGNLPAVSVSKWADLYLLEE